MKSRARGNEHPVNAAFKTALDKHGEKEMSAPAVAAERIGKFVADSNKPRPVRLVFSSLIYKHSFLELSKAFRLAGFRIDDDLTKSQQAERTWISGASKPKGTSLTFEARFCSITATTKSTPVGREKQTQFQQLHECSCHAKRLLFVANLCTYQAQ